MAMTQVISLAGTRIDGRDVSPRRERAAERRARIFEKKHGGPTNALKVLNQMLESGGINYLLHLRNKGTDKAALAKVVFEILNKDYTEGGVIRDDVFKALWKVYRADGAEVIETKLTKTRGRGYAKICALEYLLVNQPGNFLTYDRAVDLHRDEKLSSDQKLRVLQIILPHAKTLEYTPEQIQEEIKEAHVQIQRETAEVYVQKGAEAEKAGDYCGAVANYMTALMSYMKMINEAKELKGMEFAFRGMTGVIKVAADMDEIILERGGAHLQEGIPELGTFYLSAIMQLEELVEKYEDMGTKAAEQKGVVLARMQETGAKLVEAGDKMREQGNYEGALGAYAQAARIYETASAALASEGMQDKAQAAEAKGLSAIQAIVSMGDGMVKAVDALLQGIGKLGEEAAQLDKKAEGLKAEAEKLEKEGKDAAYHANLREEHGDPFTEGVEKEAEGHRDKANKKREEAEAACAESIKKVDAALNMRAEATGIMGLAAQIYAAAVSMYTERKTKYPAEEDAASKKTGEALDIYKKLQAGTAAAESALVNKFDNPAAG